MKKEQKRKILFYGILAGALLLFAACAAHLAPYDPYEQNLELSLLPPSAAHWMGTDRYGRDLFSRILSGARVSIFSALLVVAASALIGTLAGIFSGWLEGKTDTVLMQISDIFLAFPGMVFAIAFSGVLQSGMTGAVVSLILVSWPKYARLARNRVLALKHMPFIAAARLTGNGTWKMIRRHILPNLAGQTIVTAVLDIGTMMLEISGLSVCYAGEQILNNRCFSVEKGETVGIAGESGSGKSTLLRAILRLMGKNGSITGGQITFRGEELTDMSEKKLRSLCGSEIGMIFQNTGASLCPTRKIGEQICESVRAHEKRCGFTIPISGGMSGRKSRREIKDMTLRRFADMGLSDGETIWNSYPSSLSGGMNQRVGIALAMLLHPSLLLADEPTSALDVVSQAQVLRELQALQQKEQTGMVLVTHNLAVLEQMADRVAVLKDGNIVEQGETRTVFDHPKDEYTKNLLAAVPGRGKNDA